MLAITVTTAITPVLRYSGPVKSSPESPRRFRDAIQVLYVEHSPSL